MKPTTLEERIRKGGLSRREILRLTGGALGGLTIAPVLWGCGDDDPLDESSMGGAGTATDPQTSSARRTAGASSGTSDDEQTVVDSDVSGDGTAEMPRYWYFALIADSHVIDEYYEGPESNELDTNSILEANRRFVEVRDFLNAVRPRFEHVFHMGDLLHTFPSSDLAFYDSNRTSIDIAAEMVGEFEAPFHFLMGNHDYYTRHADRELWHELFADRLPSWRPYFSVDHRGFKFIFLNNYLGATHDRNSADFDRSKASFGQEQLHWLVDELEQGATNFVFLHEPMTNFYMIEREFGDFNVQQILSERRDAVELIVCGHVHRWFDFYDRDLPKMISIGSTRYDSDAFVPVQVDSYTGRYRFLNEDLWRMGSHMTREWDPESIEEPSDGF